MGFIQKIVNLFAQPTHFRTIVILVLLVIAVPLTVFVSQQQQDLRQRASGTGVQIVDANGNYLPTTLDTQVYLRINLPENWVSLGMETNKHNIINQAYAQTTGGSCSPPYQGYLGCFSSSNRPPGSVCTSSCTTDDGQNGQYCYTSTVVGNSCTSSSGQNGVCNKQGTCVATVDSTPVFFTPTPITETTSNPTQCANQRGQCTTNNVACSSLGSYVWGGYGSSYCPSSTPQCCVPAPPSSQDSGISPESGPTPTPIPNILQAIYIENKDSDGSSNGSEPLRITSGFESYINTQVPWRLNDLLPSQNQVVRSVQITLLGNQGTVELTETVTLTRNVNTPTPTPTPFPESYLDVNNDGRIDQCDINLAKTSQGGKDFGLIYNGVLKIYNDKRQPIPPCNSTPIITSAPIYSTPIYSTPTALTLPFCHLKDRGDANCDNIINLLDYELWRTEFVGMLKGIPIINKPSDFNNDGVITIVDFNIWKTSFVDPTLPH